MILFPNCKINLGLSVLNKREDGFHNIETVFYPINIKDAVEVIVSTDKKKDINFSTSGLLISNDSANNLCVKAYQLLKKDFPSLLSVQMHLHKNIPTGAGLGGGSADAAFVLTLLNKKFNLKLSSQKLIDYALQLGSDCPFFIINQPALAYGRGEILQQININLSSYKIVVINPGIHINTGWAFSQLSLTAEKSPSTPLKEAILQPISTWQKLLHNDFEKIVFDTYPIIKEIKNQLYQQGAIYAAMSGSGSTVFGIFEKELIPSFTFPKNYFVKQVEL